MTSFELEIQASLVVLPEKGRILFSVLTCEKLYPLYVAFEKKYNWGNSKVIYDAISLAYQFLLGRVVVENTVLEDMLQRIDLITPDIDDFGSPLSSFALNAATSIYSTLRYFLDGNINHITDVLAYTLDTVDLFIQEKEDMSSLDPSRDIQIAHDEFMLWEQERERNLITQLSKVNLDNITDELIERLQNSIPIIDLSLLPE
jgi:uncharacterized protein YjaG (DUF416 family)